MRTAKVIDLFIENEKEGLYFELPFDVPENVYRVDVKYSYERHVEAIDDKGNTSVNEANIVDLSLCACNGEYVGSSGSDRSHVWVSEYDSTPGYANLEVKPGKWAVIVGAYKIQPQGLNVRYELTFTYKERRLYKGDIHMHTTGSDGCLTIDELAEKADKSGLSFICVTDHNNYAHNYSIRQHPNVTVIPGVEWTHYKGHVGMLGVKKAYEGSFYVNDLDGARRKLDEARGNGAIVVINHPFEDNCGFKFGLDNVNFDCIEVWNGPFKAGDMSALKFWHGKLASGVRIAAVGGSDYHKSEIGRDLGVPCTCVYAMSRCPSDIGRALSAGNSFISFTPQGPEIFIECCGKIMGECVSHEELIKDSAVNLEFYRLNSGDVIKIITDVSEEAVVIDKQYSVFKLTRQQPGARFMRAEVYRSYLPSLPLMPALISNPVYFA